MDFFLERCATACATQPEFWLHDDDGNEGPAYVRFECVNGCIGHVRNAGRRQVTFRAIDKCMPVEDETGRELSRCDCMLEYEAHDREKVFHFIELKQRKRRHWQKDGLTQLRTTISLFQLTYPEVSASRIKAQLCNSMRPSVTTLRAEQLKRFKEELGIQAKHVLLNPEVTI